MNVNELIDTASAIVSNGRGILAADESTGTIGKRFDMIGLANDEPNRRAYRELLFTANGVGNYIGGVIMYDETIRQKTAGGRPFVDVQTALGVVPGIKVDGGAKPLAGSPNETVTEGLDGLAKRVDEYYKLGARFAKWRAVIDIGHDIPTPYAIDVNAHALARYARICQEGGLVPIVEPEVLMDGDHDIDRCDRVTTDTLYAVFDALVRQGVLLEGMLLKPNMVIAGKKCARQDDVETVAARTVRCLRRTVPPAVPGIVFLSGGQSEALATAHLNAMNECHGPLPWKLSFSYGRALQESALKAWKGKPESLAAGQAAFMHRAKMNFHAAQGQYKGEAA